MANLSPTVIEIAKLAAQGFTDTQIALKLHKKPITIKKYRAAHNIKSGKYYKAQITKTKTKFLPLDKTEV